MKDKNPKGFDSAPGPGPNDAGKGAMGDDAEHRMDRNDGPIEGGPEIDVVEKHPPRHGMGPKGGQGSEKLH